MIVYCITILFLSKFHLSKNVSIVITKEYQLKKISNKNNLILKNYSIE